MSRLLRSYLFARHRFRRHEKGIQVHAHCKSKILTEPVRCTLTSPAVYQPTAAQQNQHTNTTDYRHAVYNFPLRCPNYHHNNNYNCHHEKSQYHALCRARWWISDAAPAAPAAPAIELRGWDAGGGDNCVLDRGLWRCAAVCRPHSSTTWTRQQVLR